MIRTRLVIPWWLGVLVVVVLGTLGWMFSRSRPPEAPVQTPSRATEETLARAEARARAETRVTTEPRPTAAYHLPETPHSAQNRYDRAKGAASEWQPDAGFVSASASWPFVGLDDFSRPVDWTFQFYSPGTGRVYTVNVDQENVTPIREAVSPYMLSEIDVEHWQVDSYQAINQWLNQGGGEFLKRHPVVDVSIRLAQSPEGPEWTVVGIDKSGQTVQTVSVDARGLEPANAAP